MKIFAGIGYFGYLAMLALIVWLAVDAFGPRLFLWW